jgi:tryptophanyl-tRNA synthetase
MGLYSYPVLMAADILAFDSNVVPVGRDQAQHVEYARDLAIRMNHRFIVENAAPADVLTVPQARIDADIAAIPGLDGRKMSKSYNNVIPLYGTAKELDKAVKRIVTDSKMPGEPKDPESSNVYQIYAAFAGRAERELFASDLRAGMGWGDAKKRLYTLLDQELAPGRDTYQALMADPARIDDILAAGAEKARKEARKVLHRVRGALGLK